MATAHSLPTIEPVSMTLYDRDFEAFSQAFGASFQRYGFAVVADHGLDQQVIDRATEKTKQFFALPEEVKRSYHIQGGGGARGYTAFGVETAKDANVSDLKEFWHVGRELPEGSPLRQYMQDNIWPAEVPGFKPELLGLYNALDEMGGKLLRAVAHYLGLKDDFFVPTVKDGNSVLRLLHYPPIPTDAEGVRAGAHEDINTITLLLGAEEAGLQVKDRDGRWLPINPPPGSLVVNVGDMLQRLTNHVLPSTTHRVVNPAPERRSIPRFSTPFFLHFQPEYVIETLPECVSEDRPNLYPEPISSHEYLLQRLREIKLI
jgi:isopenicillin N synthase-like dioxygenase